LIVLAISCQLSYITISPLAITPGCHAAAITPGHCQAGYAITLFTLAAAIAFSFIAFHSRH